MGAIRLTDSHPLECQTCKAGQYQPELPLTTLIKCRDCPLARYIDNHRDDPRNHDNIDDCKRCPAAFEFIDIESKCQICPAGRYQDVAFSDDLTCKLCPAGFFNGDKRKLAIKHQNIGDCGKYSKKHFVLMLLCWCLLIGIQIAGYSRKLIPLFFFFRLQINAPLDKLLHLVQYFVSTVPLVVTTHRSPTKHVSSVLWAGCPLEVLHVKLV